jgi:hypothetical protein
MLYTIYVCSYRCRMYHTCTFIHTTTHQLTVPFIFNFQTNKQNFLPSNTSFSLCSAASFGKKFLFAQKPTSLRSTDELDARKGLAAWGETCTNNLTLILH